VPKLDPADIASLALDGMAADEYEIIADGLSRQVQAGLAGGVAALYPDLPQKPTRSPATPLSCFTHAAAWPAEDVAESFYEIRPRAPTPSWSGVNSGVGSASTTRRRLCRSPDPTPKCTRPSA
jgi:hypothetical protein